MTETERATPSEPRSDEEIVRLAVAGDADAFAEIYRRFGAATTRLAHGMTGDRAAAEDLTQEIFMRVFERLDQFERRARFSTWFYRIAVNRCLRYRGSRRVDASLDAVPAPVSKVEPVEDGILRAEVHHLVRAALLALEPKYRVVVVLKEIEGLSYAEIGARVGCSEGTVASRLSRARAQLARRLERLRGAV